MNNLIKHFTYKPIVKRGLIGDKTEKHEFTTKLDEEVKEVYEAYTFKEKLSIHESEELMDVIFVCINMLIHYRINILKTFLFVYKKNKNRCTK